MDEAAHASMVTMHMDITVFLSLKSHGDASEEGMCE